MDTFLRRYQGWDYWVYKAQPEHIIAELEQVIMAEADVQRTRRQQRTPRGSGYRKLPPPTPASDVLDAARAAGLPLPGVRPPSSAED